MATGLQLSVDQDSYFQGFPSDTVALLTSTESGIINALRESLSSRNTGRVVLSIELQDNVLQAPEEAGMAAAAEKEVSRTEIRAVSVMEQNLPSVPKALPDTEKDEELQTPSQAPETPSVDEVISLIQVGQRALRISEPAVRGVPVPYP
jgi:hypothetical protein